MEVTDRPKGAQPGRRRFRFGLKSLFILTTLVCLWLGYKLIRDRRIAEMVSLRQSVYNTLTENLSIPPSDTKIVSAMQLLPYALIFRDSQWIYNAGDSREYNTDHLDLALGSAIASKPGDQLVRDIAAHVARGLDRCGLAGDGGLTQSIGSAWRYIGSWRKHPSLEFTVFVEVVAEPGSSKSAVVWVGVLENQKIFDWNWPPISAMGSILVLLFLWIIWLRYLPTRSSAQKK